MELGHDLTRISPLRRWGSVVAPFAWSAGYFLLAADHRWIAAIVCLVILSFITYGSVSHDLVHRNLGLAKRTNDLLLVLIELLALRSGTAYRLVHLHHHRRFPADDDVEGAAAKMSPVGALIEGIRFQIRIYRWAWKRYPHYRKQLNREGALVGIAYVASILVVPWNVSPFIYVALMTVGAWIIPFITSWIPHDPHGRDEVHQTRAFRGVALKIIAWQHLYHLEHHLYPAVPHHNWPELARRLDPFLQAAEVRPIRLWF
jgi:beta-carotene hydroxylase